MRQRIRKGWALRNAEASERAKLISDKGGGASVRSKANVHCKICLKYDSVIYLKSPCYIIDPKPMIILNAPVFPWPPSYVYHELFQTDVFRLLSTQEHDYKCMHTRPIEGDKCSSTLSVCSKSVAVSRNPKEKLETKLSSQKIMSVSSVRTDDQVEFALNILLKQRNDWQVQLKL